MIHPIIFKDKCSCGGNLFFVKSDHSTTKSIDNNSGDIVAIKCIKCNATYPIRWNIIDGEPYPILDEELELKKFMEEYTKEN